MKPHAVDGRWRRARSPAGFSLAEMMIALAILGMGLLVIGAALPIGIRYTRASVNKATGEAAVEYALDVIEQNVCLRGNILDRSAMPPTLISEPGLFQPRSPTTGLPDPTYEPVIKVRPLYVRAINAAPGTGFGQQEPDLPTRRVRTEQVAYNWLLGILGSFDTREVDPSGGNLDPWMRWALPSVATVYPPISSDEPFDLNRFINTVNGKYEPREVRSPWSVPAGSETLKALDRRIVWTAFYRRVSYEPGSDPALYEFVVVALRVPGAGYRFPMQDPNDGGVSIDGDEGPGTTGGNGENGEMTVTGQGNLGPSGGYGSAATGGSSGGHFGGDGNSVGGASGDETGAPVPWLVSFDGNVYQPLPVPPQGFDPATGYPVGADGKIMTVGSPNAPASLTFRCTAQRSGLFPVGAIFIPARNDYRPFGVSMPQYRVGFGPPAPTALPIYEVTERPDDTTVIVKFNGYYPMQGTPGQTALNTPPAGQWPVWVIPPAFAEYEGTFPNQQPVAPDQCQIVAVARRYMRLREVP